MIPKVIHLCWFSDDPYPVEIKVCLDTWKRLMPDYVVKVWDYAAAKSIGSAFIDEALEARKWAFAADVVRFYAVYEVMTFLYGQDREKSVPVRYGEHCIWRIQESLKKEKRCQMQGSP